MKRRRIDTSGWKEELEAEFLPVANVMSLVKSVIPQTVPAGLNSHTLMGRKVLKDKPVKLGKSFRDLLQVCVAEFIHVIAGKLLLSGRKGERNTFTDEDILHAMEGLGIGQYSTILRLFMNDYRELVFDVLTKRLNKSLTPDVLLGIRDA